MKKYLLLTYCLLLGFSFSLAQNQTNLRTVNPGGKVVEDGLSNTWQFSIGETFVAPIGNDAILTQGFNQPLTEIKPILDTTIWVSGSWSNGLPDTSKVVLLSDDYFTSATGGFTAWQLLVAPGINFSIDDDVTIIDIKDSIFNDGSISRWCVNNSFFTDKIEGNPIEEIQPVISTDNALLGAVRDSMDVAFMVEQMTSPTWSITGLPTGFEVLNNEFKGTSDIEDTTTFYVEVSQNNCTVLDSFDLKIQNIPIGFDVQVACGSYEWLDGNTYTSSSKIATYTITGGGANGLDSLVVLDLTIQELPTITLVSTIDTSCGDKDFGVQYLTNDTVGTLFYTVFDGASSIQQSQNTAYTIDLEIPYAEGTLKLVIDSIRSQSCLLNVAQDTILLQGLSLPQLPVISGDSIPNCDVDTTFYAVQNLAENHVVNWSFDTLSLASTNGKVDSSGILGLINVEKDVLISAVVTSDMGCVSSPGTLLVQPQNCELTADFIVLTDTICLSDSIRLVNTSSGGPYTSISWSFLGPENHVVTSQMEELVEVLPKAGLFDIELIVSNGITSDTLLKKQAVYVSSPLPESSLILGDSAVCFGASKVYSLNNSSLNTYTTQWNVEIGTLSDVTNDSVVYLPSIDSVLSIDSLVVTVTSGCGQTKEYTKQINHVNEDLKTIQGLETCEQEGVIRLTENFRPYKLSFVDIRDVNQKGILSIDSLDVTFSNQGQYVVRVEDTLYQSSCVATDTINIGLIPGFELVDDQEIIDETASISISLKVLDNDTKFIDPDLLKIRNVITSNDFNRGTLTIDDDSTSLNYEADGFVGIDTFFYVVNNTSCLEGLGLDTARILVNIPKVNDDELEFVVSDSVIFQLVTDELLINDVGGLDTIIYFPTTSTKLGTVDTISGEVSYSERASIPPLDTALYKACIVDASFSIGYNPESCRDGKVVMVFNLPRNEIIYDILEEKASEEFTKNDLSLKVYNVVTPNGDGVHDYLNMELYLVDGGNVPIKRADDDDSKSKLQIFTKWGDLVYEVEDYRLDEQEEKGFSGLSSKGEELVNGTYYYIYELDVAEDKDTDSGFLEQKSYFNASGFLILKRPQ